MRTDRHRRLPRPPRRARTAAGALLLAASALVLTGCQASPHTRPSASHTASATASAPSSGATSTPTATPTPVTLACDQVLTTAQLTAMVPTITRMASFTPDKGTDAAKAVGFRGIACGYTNPKTGNPVAVSIARPAADDLTSLKNTAITTSNVVPTYGTPPTVMGYFAVTGGAGVAEAFTGDYWITAVSKDYIEPGDAGQVITGVLANLPH